VISHSPLKSQFRRLGLEPQQRANGFEFRQFSPDELSFDHLVHSHLIACQHLPFEIKIVLNCISRRESWGEWLNAQAWHRKAQNNKPRNVVNSDQKKQRKS
jgi:hypothetical protein